MKMEITNLGIKIIPETTQDEIYIEYFLGLKNDKDKIDCVRENAMGLSCIAHLKIKPQKKDE